MALLPQVWQVISASGTFCFNRIFGPDCLTRSLLLVGSVALVFCRSLVERLVVMAFLGTLVLDVDAMNRLAVGGLL
jgi:hypothetical protein